MNNQKILIGLDSCSRLIVHGLGLACQAQRQYCHTKKSIIDKIFTKKKKKNEEKGKVPPATTL